MDIAVADNSIYELKTVAKLNAQHAAQLMNYLLMVGCNHGKVINFRSVSVESRFVNAPMTIEQRRSFDVNARSWDGDTELLDCVVGLLRDWGTCLELPLYYQGLIHLLGGDEAVTKLIPLKRGDISLGNQRFHLQGAKKAFRLTAFGTLTDEYRSQLKRLLDLSPLEAIQWINIGHEQVTFTTVT
jgi:hypothetical protein